VQREALADLHAEALGLEVLEVVMVQWCTFGVSYHS
jgi:hypothetical protein